MPFDWLDYAEFYDDHETVEKICPGLYPISDFNDPEEEMWYSYSQNHVSHGFDLNNPKSITKHENYLAKRKARQAMARFQILKKRMLAEKAQRRLALPRKKHSRKKLVSVVISKTTRRSPSHSNSTSTSGKDPPPEPPPDPDRCSQALFFLLFSQNRQALNTVLLLRFNLADFGTIKRLSFCVLATASLPIIFLRTRAPPKTPFFVG